MNKKLNLTAKFAIALGVLLFASSLISGFVLWPLIRADVLHADYETLYSKERIVTDIINADETSMRQYIHDLQFLAPLFPSAFEFTDYLKDFSDNFGVSNIAILNPDGKIIYSLKDAVYNHESELKAISMAAIGETAVVKTVTEEDVMFTSTGRISLLGTNYIILCQKNISDNAYLTKIANETATTITMFLGDMRIGTSNRDKDGNYLIGRFENQKVLDVVYNKGEEYHGEVDVQGQTFLAVYRPYKTDNPKEKVMLFVGTNVNHVNSVSQSIAVDVIIAVAIIVFLLIICRLRKIIHIER